MKPEGKTKIPKPFSLPAAAARPLFAHDDDPNVATQDHLPVEGLSNVNINAALKPQGSAAEQKLRKKLAKRIKKAKSTGANSEETEEELRKKLEKKMRQLKKLQKQEKSEKTDGSSSSKKKVKKDKKKSKEKHKDKPKGKDKKDKHSKKAKKTKSLVSSVVQIGSGSKRPPTPPRYDDWEGGRWRTPSPQPGPSHLQSTVNVVGDYADILNRPSQRGFTTYYQSGWAERRGGGGGGARRGFTGYQHNDRRSRSRSPHGRFAEAARRPSPPRDMPEHIRWLHERWRRYDTTEFFSKQNSVRKYIETVEAPTLENIGCPRDWERSRRWRAEAKAERLRAEKWDREHGTGGNTEPLGDRRGGRSSQSRESHKPYYESNWHKGGQYNYDPGRVLTFKEWLLSHPDDHKDHDKAMELYNEYKLDYRRQTLARFFQAHSEEEWFLEKYHPMLKEERDGRRRFKTDRRLAAFMQLLVRGWMEISMDRQDARKVRKLVDAMIVVLEGGDEGDMALLNDLDYMLEEKKEETYTINKTGDDDSDSEDEEKKEGEEAKAGQAPGGGRTKEEQALDEELHEMGLVTADQSGMVTATDLEAMQHAKDYTLYVTRHKDEDTVDVDLSNMPDDLEPQDAQRQTMNVGGGVFVSQVMNPKALAEMNLHRTSSLLIRNIAPNVTRSELEHLCNNAHGGFLRLHMLPPDPTVNWSRQAVATFWHSANLSKIVWKLRGVELRGQSLQVIEWREFKRRIDQTDGLAADKSVVLRDIQLCKSLVEHLDRRYQLWGTKEVLEDEAGEPGEAMEGEARNSNPLLINLDECLAFHLHQLMTGASGGTGEEKNEEEDAKAKLVDSDPNLTRVLDRLILYLRLVHSVDFYGCHWYEHEDDEPRRIGTVTLRGPPSKPATPKRLAKYIKRFEERLKDLLPQEKRLADEHVDILGKRSNEIEVDKFVNRSYVSIADGMAKCCLCYKRFTSSEFARMHITEKHEDKIEEIKWIVLCFNNYLADPQRPSNIEMPTPKEEPTASTST